MKDINILKEIRNDGNFYLNEAIFCEIADLSISRVEGAFPAKNNTRNTTIKIVKNEIHLEVNIKVKQGVNVHNICEKLQNKIYLNIFQTTEIKPTEINIKVVGFHN